MKSSIYPNYKILISNWKEYLFEDKKKQGRLPLDVIDVLIKKFARNPAGPTTLKRGYFDFQTLGKQWNKENSDTAASYIAPSQMLLINSDIAEGDAGILIKSTIHEIQHYNQHMRWNEDDKFRFDWTKGKKLPPGVSPEDLYDLDFYKLISFWMKAYGYDNAPHEIDARNFADKHYEEAKQIVIDIANKEKALKKTKNKDKIKAK